MATRNTTSSRHLGLAALLLVLSVSLGCEEFDLLRGGAQALSDYHACPSDLPGQSEGRTCATFDVPLRWDQPDGEHIELLVVRYPAFKPTSEQLWLLDGGPGGTGAAFMDPAVIAFYQQLGVDLYIPQHRGTGHSEPLSCDNGGVNLAIAPTAALLDDCSKAVRGRWGTDLRGFHSDEAGRDLGHLIAQTRGLEDRVFVLGVSYGSYWAQRYLQHFPYQADGVILQGAMPLDEPIWAGDAAADSAGRSLLKACRWQPECLVALGGNPEAIARHVVAQSANAARRCGGDAGPDRETLESWFGLLAGEANHAIPGLIRRLGRCSAKDQEELTRAATMFSQIQERIGVADPAIFNDVLGVHILTTDLMASSAGFSFASLAAARERLVFWSATGNPDKFALYAEHWGVSYPPVPTAISADRSPILIMSGGADMQTPIVWAKTMAAKLGAQLAAFPNIGHGVDFSLLQAPNANVECSLAIERSFMEDPETPVDTRCAASAYVPDFAGREPASLELSEQLYGSRFLLGSPTPGEAHDGDDAD